MKRKEFIRLATFTGGVVTAPGLLKGTAPVPAGIAGDLTAAELQQFLISLTKLGPRTVDRFIIGDPETRVKKIGTCWMPYWETCRNAVKSGVNILVTHEPTFYTHWDLDEQKEDYFRSSEFTRQQYIQQVEKKKKWILDNGLVIIRNHDTLDALPDKGIVFALGQFLGFDNADIIASHLYYNVYKINTLPAGEYAQKIAGQLKELGQPGVAFYGDPDCKVSSVGVGTGCICDPMEFAELKPDIFIAIDDVVRTWTQTTFAMDTGHPLIVINHGTSEEMGVRSLNRIIAERFPGIEVVHFKQGCTYRWIE